VYWALSNVLNVAFIVDFYPVTRKEPHRLLRVGVAGSETRLRIPKLW
jgi:hypothetical protein